GSGSISGIVNGYGSGSRSGIVNNIVSGSGSSVGDSNSGSSRGEVAGAGAGAPRPSPTPVAVRTATAPAPASASSPTLGGFQPPEAFQPTEANDSNPIASAPRSNNGKGGSFNWGKLGRSLVGTVLGPA
ncbi:unnamed protein product, partial [Laminaria digitata]